MHRMNRLPRLDFYDDLILDDHVGPKADLELKASVEDWDWPLQVHL